MKNRSNEYDETQTDEEIQAYIDGEFGSDYESFTQNRSHIAYLLENRNCAKTMLDAIRQGNNDDAISFANNWLNGASVGSYICYIVGKGIECFNTLGNGITLLTIPANLRVWTQQSLENELSDALINNKLNFITSAKLTPTKHCGAEGGFYSWNNSPYIYRYYENEIYKEEYIDVTHVYKRGVNTGVIQHIRCNITVFDDYGVIE